MACSLDGRIAKARTATTLSTPEGLRAAHRSRAENDAVLVGIDTVRIDDPQLTVREVAGPDPMRVVLASRLDVPLGARIFPSSRPGRLVVVGARERATERAQAALLAAGAEVELVEAGPDGMVALRPALARLVARGVKRLLVEGGARVLTSFLRERLVDRLELEIAMTLLGAPGTSLVDALDEPPRLENVEVERLGASVLIRGDVVR